MRDEALNIELADDAIDVRKSQRRSQGEVFAETLDAIDAWLCARIL